MLYATDPAWKALAPIVPNRLTAGHFLSVCGSVVYGLHPDDGSLYLLVEPQAGGWGAGMDKDGENRLWLEGGMTDSLDEALEARLQHFLRGAFAARTMRTPAAQERFMDACLKQAVRDIRKLCAESTPGPAKFRTSKRHLGTLNVEGIRQVGPRPELRLVE